VQLIAKKEILIVVASLAVHSCAIKKNVIVASQLYDLADVQFTVVKKCPRSSNFLTSVLTHTFQGMVGY